jgi:hypothetical protein
VGLRDGSRPFADGELVFSKQENGRFFDGAEIRSLLG